MVPRDLAQPAAVLGFPLGLAEQQAAEQQARAQTKFSAPEARGGLEMMLTEEAAGMLEATRATQLAAEVAVEGLEEVVAAAALVELITDLPQPWQGHPEQGQAEALGLQAALGKLLTAQQTFQPTQAGKSQS
jgi:hypothetical protein